MIFPVFLAILVNCNWALDCKKIFLNEQDCKRYVYFHQPGTCHKILTEYDLDMACRGREPCKK